MNSFQDDLTKTLEGALEEIEGKILLLSLKAEEASSHVRRKQYLEKQREEIQKVLNEIYVSVGQEIKTKAVELAEAMPGIIHKITLAGLPVSEVEVGLAVPKLSKKQVVSWFESSQIEGSFFNDWMKKLETNTVSRVIAESRRSLVLTESVSKSSKRLQEALNVSRNSARTLFNTAMQEAVNFGELESYKASPGIEKVLFVAELDLRTSPLCRELDGSIFDIEEAELHKPPLHPNCRSRLFPMFKDRDIYGLERAKRVGRKETEPRTVHHRDGSTSKEYREMEAELVPWKTTYNQWMTSMVTSEDPKDVAFAREALGPTRLNLVKDGKLKMDSLYYGGRLRTIKQLEELM